MDIKILFDSSAAADSQYSTGWGFSCLIDNHILFDTGEDGKALLKNLDLMKIDLSLIDTVVISHEHYDHISGLWDFLAVQKNVNVYFCPHFSDIRKEQVIFKGSHVIESQPFMEISKNIFLTGEIAGSLKGETIFEQALIVKTGEGITVIVGCLHPGIINMLTQIKKHFNTEKIYLVIGGLHLLDSSETFIQEVVKSFVDLNVRHIAPIHCTGTLATELFKEAYGDRALLLKVGHTVCI